MVSYLGRNVNLALLLLIIGVVVAMVGTTVFFQRSLQNRTSSLEDTSVSLESCQIALSNYQEKFTEAQRKANESSQDIRKYDQLYENKVGELKDAQSQLVDTQKKFELERLQKQKFQEYYEDQLQLSIELNATIEDRNDEISSLEWEIRELNDQLDACGG